MKSLLTGLATVCILFAAGLTATSQPCSYYYGECYPNYLPESTVEQGSDIYLEYFMYIYYDTWPDAQFPVEISTDDGSTWTTLLDNADLDGYYDYYNYYGYMYGWYYATVTIPWSIPPGKAKIRISEVPNDPSECTYTNPSEYYYWFDIEVTRGCRDPQITAQPKDLIGCQGSNYSLTGAGPVEPGYISYDWYKDGVLLKKTTTPQLDFFPITTADAGSYYFKVVDVCGKNATSQTVKVTVYTPGIITTEPVGKTVCEGQPYTMTIEATGSPLSIQWYKDGAPLPGKTAKTYVIASATGADQGLYYVIVNGGCGDPDTSQKVTIAVPTKPVFATPLQGGFFCPGTTAVISPDVSGSILAYQWYRVDTPIIGATSRNLTIPNISRADNDFYWVEVSVPGSELSGCPAITKSGRVYVGAYESPVIKQQPASVDACSGSDQRLVVEADGTGLSYQWFRNGSPIPNSDNYSLSLDNMTGALAGDYTVAITGVCGFVTTSEVAEVHVYSLPTITQQPQSMVVKVGETITLNVGCTGEQTIIWMRNEQEIARGTSTTLAINNAQLSDAGYYRAIVQNVCGGVTSRSALVGVTDPASLIPTIAITSTGLDAGDVPFGYWADRTFTALIVNPGNVDITVTGYSFSGANSADFVVQSAGTPYTLAPGAAHEVVIRFTPSSVGTSAATMSVASSATAGNSMVPIVGDGVLLYNADKTLEFGVVDKTQSTIKCFNVNNISGTTVVIDAINITGVNSSEFRVTTTLPMSIGAGETKEICVEFTPLSEGVRSVLLSLMSSTGGNSQVNANGTCEVASSVVEDGSAAGMSIYPNPASGNVTINTGSVTATTVMIVDAQGAVVSTLHPTSSVFTWDVRTSSGMPVSSGVYNVVITNEAGAYHLSLHVVR